MISEAERERLVWLIEECSEVIQASTKILRFGYDEVHGKDSNRDLLSDEVADVCAVIQYMEGDFALLDAIEHEKSINDKIKKKLQFASHQKD